MVIKNAVQMKVMVASNVYQIIDLVEMGEGLFMFMAK